MENCTEEFSSPSVQATVQAVETEDSEPTWCMMTLECARTDEEPPTPFSRAEFCQAQREDPDIGPVINCKQSGQRPAGQQLKSFSTKNKRLLREWDKLSLDGDGVLYRKTVAKTQLVLPEKYKTTVLLQRNQSSPHSHCSNTAIRTCLR